MARVLDSVTLPIKKNGTKTNQNYVNNPKSIAPQFSASTAYTAGQYVFYDKKLYRFKVDHAAGAWNAAHAEERTVGAEISALKQDLRNVEIDYWENDSEVPQSTEHYYTGYRLKTDGFRETNAGYNLYEYKVYAGDILKIVTDDKYQFMNSYIVNASGSNNVVGKTLPSGTYYEKVPTGAVWLVISTPSGSTAAKVYKVKSAVSNINNDVSNINDEIDTLQTDVDNITGVPKVEYIMGKYVGITQPLTMVDGEPVLTGTSSAWKCAIIPCSEGDKFTINGASNNSVLRAWAFAESDGTVIDNAPNPFDVDNNLVITAPENAAWFILNSNNLSRGSYIGTFIRDQIDIINESLDHSEYNDSLLLSDFPKMVKPIEITDKTYVALQINTGGIVATSSQRKSVICRIVPNVYIDIKKIQTQFAWIGFSTEYPVNGTVLNEHYYKNAVVNTKIGLQAGANDHYMIFMYYDSTYDSSESDIIESMHIYYDCAEYSQFGMVEHADSHMINLLKYRPVGRVSKPYIAISCDDGNAVLATYTIPQIKSWAQTYGKNIPVTFGLMDNSQVMTNDTYKELVIEACEDYDCGVAIHGAQSYLVYSTRKALASYIEKQDKFLYEELGVKPSAVIYPEHQYNDFIQTYCGAYYNTCGCGGTIHNLVYEDGSGRPFYIGEKSNCYEIYRLAIHDTRITSLNDVEDIVDYAYDHNFIICPYFHDVDLDDDAPNKTFLRSVLDKFVSYGVSKGIDFIKLGDIPYVL